jgi:RNA polymerase sigma-70 factor (ECF subfamily)
MVEISDEYILSLIRNDESFERGFNLLVEKYQQKVYWLVRRLVIDHEDSDDVVQEIFIKVWKNLKRFNEQSQLFTWIYRISTNEALSFLRKKKLMTTLRLSDFEHEISLKLETDPYFTGNRIQMKLQKAILTLPPKQRLTFNLHYFEELKYEDIASITGTSAGSLKASYHLAVKKIEKFLETD